MISIIYSSHKGQKYNDTFNKHIKETIGVKNYEILSYENFGQFSLPEIYNRGIKESKYDILCCIHNDIKLENGWGQKLLKDFKNNPDYGIIGKAGSCYFPESGIYWEKLNQTMVGQVFHHPPGQKKWLSEYSSKFNSLIPVVTIDGLFISFDKTKIKHTFDETIGRFHFYDHPFCLKNYLDNIKIGVTTSFDITHESIGQPNEEFYLSKEVFLNNFGQHLPLDLKPQSPFFDNIKTKKFKKLGKVAIVIPTIGEVEMLKKCLDSFIKNCDTNLFEVFLADTGSNSEEISLIKNYIENNSDKVKINLIRYDYFNFASINNDVVKNHISDDFEFILFSNNDLVVLNDVISGMLTVYQNNNKVGSVGARLHFEDNTVQHDGIFLLLDQRIRTIIVNPRNKFCYYKHSNGTNKVLANTASLMMIRKNDFIKIGMFNENYLESFEDIELNLGLILEGYENYINADCVAIHSEAKTRNKNLNQNQSNKDFNNFLNPYIVKNFEKLKSKIYLKS